MNAQLLDHMSLDNIALQVKLDADCAQPAEGLLGGWLRTGVRNGSAYAQEILELIGSSRTFGIWACSPLVSGKGQ